MKKGLKIFFVFLFLIAFTLILILSQKYIENYFFASITQPLLNSPEIKIQQEEKPIRNRKIEDLEIEAKSAISVFVDKKGNEKILFENEGESPLPIASLTKLMTAALVLENYELNEENSKLLFRLLIKSDNDATENLAEIFGKEDFIKLMNSKARELKMENTYFANPTGLDPQNLKGQLNFSTARDLVKLAKYITFQRSLIWEISTIPEYENATNTNELLGKIPEIIGGKTGETPLSGKCLLLVLEAPKNKGFIINVILNSKKHFEEMKKLVDWTKNAYKW